MSVTTPIVWPELPHATVRWRAATVKADGPDEDLSPDWAPLVGKSVRLTPHIDGKPFGMVAYDRLGPDPITIWVEKVDAIFNSNGYLTLDGSLHPVRILATDHEMLSTTGWYWVAEFEGFKVSFSAPAGSEINLTPYMSAPLEVESKLWVEKLLELEAGTGSGVRSVSGTVTLGSTPGLYEVYALDATTVQGVALVAGDAAVFRLLGGAWSYMVVGVHTSWQAVPSGPGEPVAVVASAPTWTDDTLNGGGSWSTPAISGVAYSPASGTAAPGQSVTVTATAQPGYILTGTSSWTHPFPVAEVAEPDITEDFAVDGALAGKTTTTGALVWTADTQATNYSGAWANAVATRSSGALVSATPANPAAGYVEPATAPVKAEAAFNLPSTDGQLWLSIRAGATAPAGSGDNIYVVYIRSQSAFKMYHGDGGTLVQVGSSYASTATTGTVAIELIGTAAKVHLDGAVIISGTTTKTPTGTKAAIGVKGVGASVDNFKVWLS